MAAFVNAISVYENGRWRSLLPADTMEVGSSWTFTKPLQFSESVGDPSNVSNKGHLYSKDVSGKVELFWQQDDGATGQVIQITNNGALVSPVPYVELTSGEAIAIGDLVALNTSGEAVLANADITLDRYRIIGVAITAAAGASLPVRIAFPGSLSNVSTDSVLPGSANSTYLYLSTTPGKGTTTPPWATPETATVIIGVIQGADGVTSTPAILLQPSFVEINP